MYICKKLGPIKVATTKYALTKSHFSSLTMNDLDKKFYKISDVAEILGLAPSTLRFWESKFTIIHPRRNDHGTRFYTPQDIEIIRMIHFLVKEKGLKLDAAQEQIRNNRSGVSRRHTTVERLKAVRGKLQMLLDALNSREAMLVELNRKRQAQAAEKKTPAKRHERNPQSGQGSLF